MFEFEQISESVPEGRPLIMAGPCSAESRAQTLAAAQSLAATGVRWFRAGLWKPRTKPSSFDGVGARGLPWLAEVQTRTGMKAMTEIASPAHLRAALNHGIRNFWLGARTVANPFAVQEIADEIRRLPKDITSSVTIFVKNPVNPDIDLWIGAVERLYSAGVRRLGAIHRGFSSYGEHIYRNPPEWRIPLELRHRLPDLPLICDPSHIAGRRERVPSVAQQALDLNFDGLFVEVHPEPDRALSDAPQQLTPDDFARMLRELAPRSRAGSDESLKVYRSEIDRIDDELIALLAKRMDVARDIGRLKLKENIPVWQSERYNELMSRRVDDAGRLGLRPEFIRKILSTIHEESVNSQIRLNEK